MDYRDERDALRGRVENLESELAAARAEVQRLQEMEGALWASRREVQRLMGEVDRLRPRPAESQNGRLWGFIAVASLAMLAAFGAAFVLRAPRKAPAEPTPAATAIAVPPPVTAVAPPPPPEPEEPEEPARPPEPPKAAARTVHAEWNATVVRSQGAAPGPGASCKILADLTGDGARASVSDLEVTCGGKSFYRSSDAFSGVSNHGSDVSESAGKGAGTLVYTVVLQDQGVRSGRAQISLDTAQRSGVVWSDNVPAFRLELRMEPASLPRTGEALLDEENRRERLAEAVVRNGTVKSVEGEPGTVAGAQCSVDVSPAQTGDSNCRVRVRCGGKVLYGDGRSGYNKCTVKDGRVGKLVDDRPSSKDTDPELDLDLAENTVVVSDDGDAAWKVTIALARAAK